MCGMYVDLLTLIGALKNTVIYIQWLCDDTPIGRCAFDGCSGCERVPMPDATTGR